MIAVSTRLESFPKDPMAKQAINELAHAQEVWRKDIHQIVQGEITKADEPTMDLPGLVRAVKESASLLQKMLIKYGKQTQVERVVKQYTATEQIAQALVNLVKAEEVKPALQLADDAQEELQRLSNAQKRVAKGGHAVFDDNVSRSATRIWRALDNAYDVLGICLRNAAIAYDATYASRPTIKTPLRHVISLTPPETSGKKRGKKKGKRNAEKKAGKTTDAPAKKTDTPPGEK